MIPDQTTTASRNATIYDLEETIIGEHASVDIVISLPSDDDLNIKDNSKHPAIAIYQKGVALVSFAATANTELTGTPRTSTQGGPPVGVWRVGKKANGKTEWAHL